MFERFAAGLVPVSIATAEKKKTTMSDLFRLVYVSEAAAWLQDQDVRDLVRSVRQHNFERRLTGVLLFTGTHFAQVLEGREAVLDAMWPKLLQDPRHHAVRQVQRTPVDARQFVGWSMGCVLKSADPDAASASRLTTELAGQSFAADGPATTALLDRLFALYGKSSNVVDVDG